ncbi:MAG TPA: tetratricopeptide repeat protein [Thermoanaerobaculia bacterium]|nr:tetratricopeptide repeat protein [Thermoanaerobaculia bacterium]
MNDEPHPEAPTVTTPAASPRSAASRAPRLADGTLLADRFRIVRFIARGGMGEVYEAEDRVLGVPVALKTIRPDTAVDERSMERFLREVHLSRSVTHPNVCRIFDVFHHEDVTFLTMELLAGETLADRLARTGKMTPAEALPLVEPMAAALGAAHDAGVIHRDFKSGNVMLVPDDRRPGGVRVVVTDFGLARRSGGGGASAAPLTKTEAVLGTPDYMAPEQIEGKDLTPAADIYALGIVLYEMVTGVPPFQGDTPLSVALKKLKEPAPSPRRDAPNLPASWERTILRCLERQPSERFGSTEEIVRALRGESVSRGPAERRRHRTLAVAIAAVVLAAAAAAYLASRSRSAPRASAPTASAARRARRAIAVLGFKNLAGRPEAAWVSTALAEMLTTELAAGETLRAIPSEDVARMRIDLSLPEADTLGRETLLKIREISGADLVLLGSYLDTGSDPAGALRLDLRLQDVSAGETIAVVSEKGTVADLDGLATRAGARLRGKLGLAAVSSTEAAAVKASLPSNPEAARLYAEGLAKLGVFEDDAARSLLEKAVAADPKHALAHSALAEAWSGLGWDAKALAEAKVAFDLSGDLARETRLGIEGRYRAMANQWERAVEIYKSVFTFFPDDLDAGLRLVHAQTRAGQPKDALATIEALRRASASPDPRIDLAEAETARALSDFPRAQKAAERAAELAERQGARLLVASALLSEASARRNLGDAKSALERAQKARAEFEAAGDRSGAGAAWNEIGNGLYDLGDLPGAKKAYEEALAIYRAIGHRRGQAGALDNIANVVGDQGDSAAARRLSEEALAIYREIGEKAGEAQTLNNIGTALVVQGDFRGARALFEQALPLYRETGDRGGLAICLNNVGEMEVGQGDYAAARNHFEEALRIFRESNQPSKSVYPLVGLAGTLAETGDLAGARKMLEEALALSRQAGDRHEEAYALAGLGGIALAEDRLPDARGRLEEARSIRETLGEKDAVAATRVALARVLLAEGKPSDARALAGAAGEALRKSTQPDDEAAALVVTAAAFLDEGRAADARRALDGARSLVAAGQNDAVRRAYDLASARALAASGDPAAAKRALEGAAAKAKERGLIGWELEVRLALGRIEAKSGDAKAGREALERVAADAEARGYRLIAREARSAPR